MFIEYSMQTTENMFSSSTHERLAELNHIQDIEQNLTEQADKKTCVHSFGTGGKFKPQEPSFLIGSLHQSLIP